MTIAYPPVADDRFDTSIDDPPEYEPDDDDLSAFLDWLPDLDPPF